MRPSREKSCRQAMATRRAAPYREVTRLLTLGPFGL
jgi:hypothetical protein